MEERLIEAAIQEAFETRPTSTLQKQAYQARYEISTFEGNVLPTGPELQYGPTIISTRSNFLLANSGDENWWTMGDFLDEDQDGEPDILPALRAFRDTNNPNEYLRVLKNRGATADTGTIQLINLIQLDGRFSQTNQLLSTCFSATNEREFVFETLVGVADGQAGVFNAIPEQTTQILLAGSTALQNNEKTANTVDAADLEPEDASDENNDLLNKFHRNGEFVETLEIPLFVNLVPNRLEPGADTVARAGRVFFTSCASFSYFA